MTEVKRTTVLRRTAVLGFLAASGAGISIALAAPSGAASPTPSSTVASAVPTVASTPVATLAPRPVATTAPSSDPLQIQVPAGNARRSSAAGTPWLQIGLAAAGSMLVVGAGAVAAARR